MKENERGGEEENECPDLYGALNVENTATSIEVRIYLSSYFFFSVFAIEFFASLFLFFFFRFCDRTLRISLLFSFSSL
jgi:hypothetical protein